MLYEAGITGYATGSDNFRETSNASVVTAANGVLNSINIASLSAGDMAQ